MLNLFIFKLKHIFVCFVLSQNRRYIPLQVHHICRLLSICNDRSVNCFFLSADASALLLLNSLSIGSTTSVQRTLPNQKPNGVHYTKFYLSTTFFLRKMHRICNQQILYSENHNEINSDKIYAVNATEDELQ